MKKALLALAVILCFAVQAYATPDPCDRFMRSISAVAEKIQRDPHTTRDGSLRLWSGLNYVLVTHTGKDGDEVVRFFTTDGDMRFAGGITVSYSRRRSLQRFFGDSLKSYGGVWQIGDAHKWAEFDFGRSGVLKSIYFTLADIDLSPSIRISFEENVRRISR